MVSFCEKGSSSIEGNGAKVGTSGTALRQHNNGQTLAAEESLFSAIISSLKQREHELPAATTKASRQESAAKQNRGTGGRQAKEGSSAAVFAASSSVITGSNSAAASRSSSGAARGKAVVGAASSSVEGDESAVDARGRLATAAEKKYDKYDIFSSRGDSFIYDDCGISGWYSANSSLLPLASAHGKGGVASGATQNCNFGATADAASAAVVDAAGFVEDEFITAGGAIAANTTKSARALSIDAESDFLSYGVRVEGLHYINLFDLFSDRHFTEQISLAVGGSEAAGYVGYAAGENALAAAESAATEAAKGFVDPANIMDFNAAPLLRLGPVLAANGAYFSPQNAAVVVENVEQSAVSSSVSSEMAVPIQQWSEDIRSFIHLAPAAYAYSGFDPGNVDKLAAAVGEQMLVRILGAAGGSLAATAAGEKAFKIELWPDALGYLKLECDMENGEVRVGAEKISTLQLIEKNTAELKQAVAAAIFSTKFNPSSGSGGSFGGGGSSNGGFQQTDEIRISFDLVGDYSDNSGSNNSDNGNGSGNSSNRENGNNGLLAYSHGENNAATSKGEGKFNGVLQRRSMLDILSLPTMEKVAVTVVGGFDVVV